jgi:hypothetical protein
VRLQPLHSVAGRPHPVQKWVAAADPPAADPAAADPAAADPVAADPVAADPPVWDI